MTDRAARFVAGAEDCIKCSELAFVTGADYARREGGGEMRLLK